MSDKPKNGQLRVWHIPQVPSHPFHVDVPDVQTAVLVMTMLDDYDLFQFRNNIKPDYASAQGLQIWLEELATEVTDDGWVDWFHDTGEDFWDDPHAYVEEMKRRGASAPLSQRLRPDVEAAPWVIEKVELLEQELADAYRELWKQSGNVTAVYDRAVWERATARGNANAK